MFERYVNSKDNQTKPLPWGNGLPFERYVNSKDNQTLLQFNQSFQEFERYVNSKDNQTVRVVESLKKLCLRDM